jgi:hypothetical protein
MAGLKPLWWARTVPFGTSGRSAKGAIEFSKANRIALVRVSAERVTYAVKSWLPKIKLEFVVPESKSLADFLFEGNILDNPTSRSQSKAGAMQLWRTGYWVNDLITCKRRKGPGWNMSSDVQQKNKQPWPLSNLFKGARLGQARYIRDVLSSTLSSERTETARLRPPS